jgi:hypothetical protein
MPRKERYMHVTELCDHCYGSHHFRIRVQLFTLMRFRILLLTLMRTRIVIKVMQICNHTGLHHLQDSIVSLQGSRVFSMALLQVSTAPDFRLWCRIRLLTSTWNRLFLRWCGSIRIPIRNTVGISVADPVPDRRSSAFLTPGSGTGKKSEFESGMNNPDHISESLETNFLGSNTYLFDTGSGMGKIRIRDNHPESATLLLTLI